MLSSLDQKTNTIFTAGCQLLQAALKFRQQGFVVFPVGAGQDRKAPFISGWQNLTMETVTEQTIHDWWTQYPTANIAILCGSPSGIFVVDVDCGYKFDRVTNKICKKTGDISIMDLYERFGETVPLEKQTYTVRTASDGWHFYFKSPENTIINKCSNAFSKLLSNASTCIDILGQNSYVVSPPSYRHDVLCENGTFRCGVYRKLDENMSISSAPEWLINLLLEKQHDHTIRQQVTAQITNQTPFQPANIEISPYVQAALESECQKVATAPVGMRNQQLNISVLKLGRYVSGGVLPLQIMKDKLIEASYKNGTVADDGGTKNVEATIKSCLKKALLEPRGVPQPQGVKMQAKLCLQQTAQSDPEDDELEVDESEVEEDEALVWPEKFLHPEGLLEIFMDYGQASSRVSIRPHLLGAGLAMLGTLLGKRIQSDSGLDVNLFILNLAPSGAGKDSALKTVRNILKGCRSDVIDNHYGGDDISSSAAILNLLSMPERRRSLLTVDEMGLFLNSIKSKNAPSYRSEIQRLVTQLFSRGYYRKIFASEDYTVDIPWCSLSLLGASVPSAVWPALANGDKTNGFLPRFLVFAAKKGENRNYNTTILPVPTELTKVLRVLVRIAEPDNAPDFCIDNNGRPKVNLENVMQDEVKPVTIQFTDDAKDFYMKMDDNINAKIDKNNNNGDEFTATVLSRRSELAIKISMIHAISNRYNEFIINDALIMPKLEQFKIQVDDLQWAYELVELCQRQMIQQGKVYVADSEFELLYNRVLNIIRTVSKRNKKDKKQGFFGCRKRDITRHSNLKIRGKELDEALLALKRDGYIKECQVLTAATNRTVTVFVPARVRD